MVPIKTFSPWNLNILLISSLAVLLSTCITIFTKKKLRDLHTGIFIGHFEGRIQAPPKLKIFLNND